MENIKAFPELRIVEQEAAAWLVKLDGDEPLVQEELEALREWLARSPVHRKELERLSSFWANNVLTELVVPLGSHETGSNTSPFQAFGLWRYSGVGAMAGVVALSIVLVLFFMVPGTKDNGLYLTAVGQQRSVTLADGSTVQLNTNSQIKVEFDPGYRNIRLLQGEAHFDVAKDSQRPFRVYAGGGRAQAVGTAFTVYLQENGVNVLVTEGRVSLAQLSPGDGRELDVDPVKSQSQEIGVLNAGESITLEAAESEKADKVFPDLVEVINDDELSRRQSWRDGLLVFSGEPLEQAVMEISRYTTVEIDIPDPELRKIQIGGRFKVGDIDNMFKSLEANFGLQVNRISYNRVQLNTAE